jgi:hypothetical protein
MTGSQKNPYFGLLGFILIPLKNLINKNLKNREIQIVPYELILRFWEKRFNLDLMTENFPIRIFGYFTLLRN